MTLYLFGLLTLPALAALLLGALYAWSAAVGWYRRPVRRWSALARLAGASIEISERHQARAQKELRLGHTSEAGQRVEWAQEWRRGAIEARMEARRWARWCAWWPGFWMEW